MSLATCFPPCVGHAITTAFDTDARDIIAPGQTGGVEEREYFIDICDEFITGTPLRKVPSQTR